jgi:glycosyltransferase involved in cell wall biosynthesis
MAVGERDGIHLGDEHAGLPSLRILVVTVAAGGIGGMQRHTHDLVRGLVAAGHDVEVVCPAAPTLAPDLYGARWTLLRTRGRSDPAWGAKLLEAYAAAAARAPFDVVHSESTSAAPLARHGIDAPITIMYHGNFVSLSRAYAARALHRPSTAPKEAAELVKLAWRFFRDRNAWAFRHCETMVVSRQQVRDTALSSLIRNGRVHVVPNGVDIASFRPRDRARARSELGLREGRLLVAVGRLNREKGFDVALEAFARIAPDYPETRLVIVGDGEERTALETLAQRLGVAPHVAFVGPQPQEKVAAYLAAADVFVFPTRREEAGPLVLPQAMAAGLPVVASRIGGIPEVLEPQNGTPAGVLVRPGSTAELEAALRRLLDDPELRLSLGRAARRRAESEYSLETMVQRTVAVYRAAIARVGNTV